jgi:hypothetical protein
MPTYKKPGSGGGGGGPSVPADAILPSPYYYALEDGQLKLMKEVSGQQRMVTVVSEYVAEFPGSVQSSPGSVKIGQHALGSSGENFTAVNRSSGIAWFPAWQGVSRDGQTRYGAVKRVLAPTTDEQPFGGKDAGQHIPCDVSFTTTTRSAYFVVDVEFAPEHAGYSGIISWRASRTDGQTPELSQFFREIDLSGSLSQSITLDYPLYLDSGTPIRLEILDDMGQHMSVAKANGGVFPWLRFTECLYQDVDINAMEATDKDTGQGTGRWFKPAVQLSGSAVIGGYIEVDGPDFN